ncbi:thiazolylpeptide-type bacteriocin [Amycolatopsis sp. lyj-108]|uniref:thiazolylpeptide-type bacteriocin n=1 Tax=Amycolatopsis sp. lyj-108 TaxID=2789286 RepID=UPI00397B2F88
MENVVKNLAQLELSSDDIEFQLEELSVLDVADGRALPELGASQSSIGCSSSTCSSTCCC